MGDNSNQETTVMDLDLNQEPLVDPPVIVPSLRLGPLLNELETAHDRIEHRIRQLEAATARARQRQRWRHATNHPESSYISIEQTIVNARGEIGVYGGGDDGGGAATTTTNAADATITTTTTSTLGEFEDRVGERGRSCKRDSSHLVAKALEMEVDVKKDDGDGGSFYDCNICLDMARDPILTCCGHLFCWGCFYQVPYVDSSARECPVCKGEVTDSGVTPIYGNGKDTQVSELESGVKVPPRPRARRIESVRQQRATRGISHIPVAEALRRIRIGIGAIGENPRLQGFEGENFTSETVSRDLFNPEAGSSRRHRSRQFSRVLSESAASLSSISSALNNAERLVEDLETYINDRLLRRTDAQVLPVRDSVPSINAVDMQPEPQTIDSSIEVTSSVPISLSSRTLAANVVSDNRSLDNAVEIDLNISRPSSSRRRSGFSRTSEGDSGIARELRRRRLR